MEGAARDRLVAVRRCGGTPMRQMRRPEGPSLASIGPDRLLGFLVSYMPLAGSAQSRQFLGLSGASLKARGNGIDACTELCDY